MRERWLALSLLVTACTPRPRPTTDGVAPIDAAQANEVEVTLPADAGNATATDAAPLRAAGPYGVVFVSSTTKPPMPLLYLHGMWSSPEDSCSYFERAAIDAALVCPRGNRPLASGSGWSGSLVEKRRSVDDALAIARDLAPTRALDDSGVAMGFSSGAAMALELALAEPGRFRGLVLMSMVMKVDATKLKAAGVKRVVFAAGELDGSYASMIASAKATSAAGVEARFVSLGKVGHHFAVDMETLMVDVVAWARGD